MKNRMQDLDFEQTVAFDSVKDFEFTRKAAQKFRQVVSLDEFEDEDADVIFHYLYKERELVSFGDHLKRYIYERAGLEEPYNEVTQDIYRDIVIESFHETCTPKSMNPTSTKLTSLANNWLTQASVKRETVFLLGFGLRMSVEDVSDFLTRVMREQDFNFHNQDEVIYCFCYYRHLGYHKAEELKKKYTIIIVTHNMQQAVRISDRTAFFLLGELVEYGDTEKMFSDPVDKRTEDYITGRFG